MVKIFLNVSKDEQARRFISRIDTPKKNWKFSSCDIDERAYWDEYMEAYETCINRTARKDTPWYVVPADHKWYARLVISRIVLNELKNMDPKWPVLDEEEMAKLRTYRERLAAETEPQENNEEDDGKKLKPSDTAVGIALKNDRQALSEKKFRKLLKKSVFENFSERFGVSEQTQEQLGKIYLNTEEAEAKAEEDDLAAVKSLYQEKKNQLEEYLKGCGKEARKLLESYKKASKVQISALVEKINLSYTQYEEELKQFMAEYEIAVGTEGISADDALTEYRVKVQESFEAHRSGASECRTAAEEKLNEIAAEYLEIGKAFHKSSDHSEEPVEESDADTATADTEPIEEEEVQPLTEESEPLNIG